MSDNKQLDEHHGIGGSYVIDSVTGKRMLQSDYESLLAERLKEPEPEPEKASQPVRSKKKR